jgi:hypothetical protein
MVSIKKAATHARMHAERAQLLLLKQYHAMHHACRF